MPLPTPQKDETKNEFMDRCMDNSNVQEEADDNDQAIAICLNKWRNKNNE